MFNRKVFSVHEKKAYEKMEVHLDLFLSLTFDRREWPFTRQNSVTLG